VRLYSGASARHVRPPVGVLLVVGIGGPVRLYSGASARHVRPPVGVLLVVGIGGPVRLYPGASARHVRPPGGEGKFTRRWDWCPGASLFGGFGSPCKTTGGNWRSAFVVFFFFE